jgi:hypothetical protein
MSKGRITFAGSAAEAGERMKAHMGARRLVS